MLHENENSNGCRLSYQTYKKRCEGSGYRSNGVHIPPTVKNETVDDGKKKGYQDALVIEENIINKSLLVIEKQIKSKTVILAMKGELKVLSLYLMGGYDAIASDDRRFLKRLESENIPFLTPMACVIYLYKRGQIERSSVFKILEKMRSFISSEEYRISKFYLEGKT